MRLQDRAPCGVNVLAYRRLLRSPDRRPRCATPSDAPDDALDLRASRGCRTVAVVEHCSAIAVADPCFVAELDANSESAVSDRPSMAGMVEYRAAGSSDDGVAVGRRLGVDPDDVAVEVSHGGRQRGVHHLLTVVLDVVAGVRGRWHPARVGQIPQRAPGDQRQPCQ